jgi:hypothetical protein
MRRRWFGRGRNSACTSLPPASWEYSLAGASEQWKFDAQLLIASTLKTYTGKFISPKNKTQSIHTYSDLSPRR